MKEHLFIPQHAIGRVWFSDSPNLDYFHRHDELECNIVVRGRGSYIVDGQRIDLEPQTVAWLFPKQEHLMLNPSDDFALWIIVIRPEYLQLSCVDEVSRPLLEHNPAGFQVRHISTAALHKLESICQEAVAASTQGALHNAILGYLLHSCWDVYQKGSMIPHAQNVHPAVRQIAQKLLDGSPQDDLMTLSGQVGLTPETVSRLFKKQTGVSFSHYRNRCRLERFLNLYVEGYRLTMLDAARDAGFGSYAQFYRVFCKMMGQTPASYQKRLSNLDQEEK